MRKVQIERKKFREREIMIPGKKRVRETKSHNVNKRERKKKQKERNEDRKEAGENYNKLAEVPGVARDQM
jgi:hypothetical protein